MILEKVKFSANDDYDTVIIKVGDLHERVGYNVGFGIDQALRVGAKAVAGYYGAPASFWRDVEVNDLQDTPKPHRTPRESTLTPSCSKWEVKIIEMPLVTLLFDERGVDVDMELAVKLGHEIRRASRRAKAWAGDTSRARRMTARLTDANAA